MGHELEHALNTNKDPTLEPSWDNISDINTPNLMDCINKKAKYLLNESETNANVREFMSRSKYKGEKIEDALDYFIRYEFLSCNPTEVNKHIEQNTELGKTIENFINTIKEKYRITIQKIYPNRRHKL